MTASQDFDFYGSSLLRVIAPRRTLKFLRQEWPSFQRKSDLQRRPNILVEVQNRLSPTARLKWRKYSQYSGSVVVIERHKFFTWHIQIELEESQIHVRCSLTPLSSYILHSALLEPLLVYHLAQCGFAPLHAACVELKGRSWIIAGDPGSGKTTLMLRYLSAGARYVTDEIVFLKDGHAWAFPQPIRLYRSNLRALPNLERLLTPAKALEIRAKGLIWLASGGYVKIPSRIFDLSNAADQPIEIGGIIHLVRDSYSGRIEETEDISITVERLVTTNRLQWTRFFRLLDSASPGKPGSESGRFEETTRGFLRRNLERVHRFVVRLPEHICPGDWDTVFDRLSSATAGDSLS